MIRVIKPRMNVVIGGVAGVLAFTPAVFVAAPAMAQGGVAKDVDPFYAVVTAERARLKAGDHDTFYTVAELERGHVIAVNGESREFSRVLYSPGWPAVAKSGEGTHDAAAGTFRLSKPATLWAFNLGKPEYCWQTLLPDAKPLASGTTLKVVGTLSDMVTGAPAFKVEAPAGATGFIETRHVRRATDAEVEAFRAKAGATLAALPGKPLTVAPKPATTPGEKPSEKPATDRTLIEPQSPTPTPAPAPGGTPGEPQTAMPVTPPGTPAGGDDAAKADPSTVTGGSGGGAAGAGQPAAEPTPAQRKAATLEQLETAFNRINAPETDVLSAEYEPLLAEINAAMEGLADTPGDAERRRQLGLRAKVLDLRIRHRNAVAKIEEAKRSANAENRRIASIISQTEGGRAYALVGVLSRSSVYDGASMPRMYRVVASGVSTPVTIGYVRPEPGVDLEGNLGRLVGVAGEAVLDPTLKLNIIKPTRIDLINTTPTTPSANPGE
ncbi:MAG: hypothetical protein HRU70_03840 [Phycisphaeraceae bacterium]|nr:MAG: hypothetical protein HRU70_03840 [Phycisphaeraceae bacterium]